MSGTEKPYFIPALNHNSIQNIMDGIDLLVHRHENELKNAINSSTLYVFKIYCFSELVLEGHKVSIELDDAVLRSTLDGN